MTRLTRNQRRRAVQLRDEMAKAFPRCFMPRGGTEKRPLKRGIERDLAAAMPTWSDQDVWIALADYTSGATYFRCLVEGAARIGLDGEPCGEAVSPEAAKQARAMLLTRLHRPLITDLVAAIDLLLPIATEQRDSLIETGSRLEAGLEPIPGTICAEHEMPVAVLNGVIGKAESALAQVRELLR